MGRGAFDLDDIVRVGLNTLTTAEMTLIERLEELLGERRSERGIEPSADEVDSGVTDRLINSYLASQFPHERAARMVGDALDLDWATLTLALYLPSYPERVDAGASFPRSPGLEFQLGLALRTVGARSLDHGFHVQSLSEWMRLGMPREALSEHLDWIIEREVERAEAGGALPKSGDYFSAAEKMRWLLRDAALAEGVQRDRKALAQHFGISNRQTSLIFSGQERELRTPSWEAVTKVSKFLRLPEARVWLALASEALPYGQRVRRQGTMTLHGQLEKDFQLALELLPFELPHVDPGETSRGAELIALQVQDGLQVRFERSNWEQPYHRFVKEAGA